jgi:hypothetical protein
MVVQKQIEPRVVDVVDAVIEPNQGIKRLIALTVASVVASSDASPMFPLLDYAVKNFATKQNYKDIPMASSYNEETWVKVLGKCCTFHLPELLAIFDDEEKYGVLKHEIKHALNGG